MAADHQQVLREHGYHAVRVKAIVDETGDTRSFVLDIPNDLGELFTYRPGQFCTFRSAWGQPSCCGATRCQARPRSTPT